MRGFRSRRTVFERAVLTVIAVYALILQSLWADIVPLRMASFDPLGSLCSIDRPDGNPSAPQDPADRHADSCCALLCRTVLAAGDAAILPNGILLWAPSTTVASVIVPTAAPSVRPLPQGGGARAPPALA